MTDYNARFQQAVVNAKLSDEVNKFIYSTSLPEPIRAQLETVIRAELHESGDPLTPGLFTLQTLMAEVVDSELLLRQARRMSQAASSSSSLNRGAGYHHTSAYPHMHEVGACPVVIRQLLPSGGTAGSDECLSGRTQCNGGAPVLSP